jgi:hypothetical protein
LTEAEEAELYHLVGAAFDAKGKPEFEQRLEAITECWRDRYELALVRRRDRAVSARTHSRRSAA